MRKRLGIETADASEYTAYARFAGAISGIRFRRHVSVPCPLALCRYDGMATEKMHNIIRVAARSRFDDQKG
jgi:hypothetical protein